MADAGFQQTEIWMSDLFEHPEGPDVAMKVLVEHNIKPIALQALRNFEGCPRESLTTKRQMAIAYLDICAALNIPLLVLASNSSSLAMGQEQCLVDDLGLLGDLAEERGVRVAYEPIAWATHVGTLEQAIPILAQLRHSCIGLQLDSFHVSYEPKGVQRIRALTPDVEVFLAEVSDHPAVKTAAIEVSRAYRLFPGEGSSDVDQFGTALSSIGYQGPLVVEVFNAYYKTLDAKVVAARAYAALSRYYDDVVTSKNTL